MQFTIQATLTKKFEVTVEAEYPGDAIQSLEDWIADDFEDYVVSARWDFEAEEKV